MAFSIFTLAAAAAAQAAAPQAATKVDRAQAQAAGYAEGQRALAGQSSLTPSWFATSLAAEQSAAPTGAQQQAPAPTDATTEAQQQAESAAPAGPGTSMQRPLALTCAGAGTADKQRGSFLAGRWGWASAISHHDRQFNDQVDVRLFSGDDRIRMPRTMLPGLHGGDGGWFKLKDVVADARSIQAHAAVAAFHNPQIYIDRATGSISISGKDGDYSGECEVIDASAAPKF